MERDRTFRAALGTSDFKKIRDNQTVYVDKTSWVADVLLSPNEVLLFPRPRRFGKTLNLSTLRYFTEKTAEDHSGLFENLDIWKNQKARQYFQNYPVIFLTFKDIKARTWETSFEMLQSLFASVYVTHRYLLDSPALTLEMKEIFSKILRQEANSSQYRDCLKHLSQYLALHHQQKVMIFIDEYDTPLHEGYVRGYYDQAAEFFRGCLSGALKDNPALAKGVLTGILRVAKESMFSDLNNLIVCSVLTEEFATGFGFTEEEVADLAQQAGQTHHLSEIQLWYNGYLFGGHVIYNPWSLLNYLSVPRNGFLPYWVQTSSNDLLRKLLIEDGFGLRGELELLLQGGMIRKQIEDSVALRDIHRSRNALWSFLLYAGYLKAANVERRGIEGVWADLTLPNLEVHQAYHLLLKHWFEDRVGEEAQTLLQALLDGKAAKVEALLKKFLLTSMSFYDVGGDNPEKVYHAFLLGLLVYLRPQYRLHSNIESGHGRADILVVPLQPGAPGMVIELKSVSSEALLESAVEEALTQMQQRDYKALPELHEAAPIHEYAIAFHGKHVLLKKRIPTVSA